MSEETDIVFLQKLEKNGKSLRKAYVIWVDYGEDTTICDCCNEKKRCATLCMLCQNYGSLCIDCIRKILKAFDEKDEDEEN